MNTLRTAAQQALEALESADFDPHSSDAIYKATIALKAALAEPENWELRRLHAENESLRQIVHDFPPVEAELREVSDRAHRLEAQRDALLEALKKIAFIEDQMYGNDWEEIEEARVIARAAIAKAEGEKI